MALTGVVLGLSMSADIVADETKAPEMTLVWSIDGGPYGSSRSLEPTLEITPERMFIDANLTKDARRYEIIRSFDTATGQVGALIEHPDGEAFEGFGDAIEANDRFLVTAISGKAQFGRGGEILVYDAETLALRHRIPNPRAEDATFFGGTGIALHGDRVLAAVPQSTDNISTAWVFSAETGEILLTLDEPGVKNTWLSKPKRSVFGRTLAMNATHIAVAANDRDGPQGLSARGVVFVFDAADGSLLHRLTSPGSGKSFGFGAEIAMSEEMIYIAGNDETGALNWPTGQVHAFDLATGDLVFSVQDPGAPLSVEDFSAGKQGWGFPTDLTVDGVYLFSGLPDWSGDLRQQGGLMVLDARTGERLVTYFHTSGAEGGAFGTAITADHGHLAVMQNFGQGAERAARVMLFKIATP